MRTAKIFQPKDTEALGEFIRQHPLASLVSCSANDIEATPLPLLAELDAEGRVVELIGHMARSNRHVEMLEQNPRAIGVFLGAHGHISPSWMRDRTQAPTWNFETAHFVIDVSFAETQDETAEAVDRLLQRMEEGRPNRWDSSELGPRYDTFIKHIVGFRASVVDARIKFKLGQNELADVYADILSGLEGTGEIGLACRHAPAKCRPIGPPLAPTSNWWVV